MFSFNKKNSTKSWYKVDFHSHLVPGIDDGVKDLDESMEILRYFTDHGYEKIITTPHIHAEYFPNTEEIIEENFRYLSERITREDLNVKLEVAAEYYADEQFIEKLEKNHPFLTFGDNHILIETTFLNKPFFLNDLVFQLQTKGYKVILAHPERYIYLEEHFEEASRLKKQGVYFQMNLGSLGGMYSRQVKKFAEKMIAKGMIDFVGSDCHNRGQLSFLTRSMSSSAYKKLRKLPILNNTLL